MSAAARCAAFAVGLAWRDVPANITAKLTAHLLDTIAVATAGAATPEAALLLDCHAGQGECQVSGPCQVIGRDARLPPVDVALLNAFAARRHTFDDTLESGPIHPGSVIWAAALAAGAQAEAPLTRVLLGALCGYELAVRLADAVGPGHYDAGYHGTGTCNAPAAGLAAAIARGLDAPRAANAIGHAAAAAAGTRQYQVDGSIAHSALNGARAAAIGVRAAAYAAAGLDAPSGQLDGKWGFLAMAGAAPQPGFGDDLGEIWGFARIGLKPYPTCRFTHGPIAAFDALRRRHGLTPDAVAAIDMRSFGQSISVSDRPTWRDRDEAILSHQFALAATLAEGPPELAALDRLAANEAVRSLAGRISIRHDPQLEARRGDDWPHLLEVRLRDGRTLLAESRTPPGSRPEDITSPAITAKAARLIGQHLGEGRVAAIAAVLAEPDRHRTADLTALLGPPDPGHAV